jgi:hypothetical protein
MKQTVKLRTSEGETVCVVLDNWGSGLDDLRRRWTLVEDCWLCTDTGELAQKSGGLGLQVLNGRNPDRLLTA